MNQKINLLILDTLYSYVKVYTESDVRQSPRGTSIYNLYYENSINCGATSVTKFLWWTKPSAPTGQAREARKGRPATQALGASQESPATRATSASVASPAAPARKASKVRSVLEAVVTQDSSCNSRPNFLFTYRREGREGQVPHAHHHEYGF